MQQMIKCMLCLPLPFYANDSELVTNIESYQFSVFPFWSDRGNGWPSERALSRHGLRGERLAAGWAGLAITKSNTAREASACSGTPDDLLIAVRQGFLTQDLVGSFAGRLNTLG